MTWLSVVGGVAAAAGVVGGCSGATQFGSLHQAIRSTNGLSANGMSINGFSINGMSINGLSINGLSINGFSINGLSINGLSINGLGSSDQTQVAADNYLFYWGLGTNIGDNPDPSLRQGLNAVAEEATVPGSLTQLMLSDPRQVQWRTADGVLHTDTFGNARITMLTYLYKITAAPYHTLTFTVCQQYVSGCTASTSDPNTFAVVTLGAGKDANGRVDGSMNLGLWPNWETHEITYDPTDPSGHSLKGEYIVSAAMAAHVNAYGRHVTFLLKGDYKTFGDGLKWTTDEDAHFPFVEGSTVAQLWRTSDQGGPVAYVASGPYSSSAGIGYRVCDSTLTVEECGSLFHYRGKLPQPYQDGSANTFDFGNRRYNPPDDYNAVAVYDAFTGTYDDPNTSGNVVTPNYTYWKSALSTVTSMYCTSNCTEYNMYTTRPADDFPYAVTEQECAPPRGSLLPGMDDMPCLQPGEQGMMEGFNDAGCCSGVCDHDADTVHGGSLASSQYYCQPLRYTLGGACTSDDVCASNNCVKTSQDSSTSCACERDTLACTQNAECCSNNCVDGKCAPRQCEPAGTSCTADTASSCCSGTCTTDPNTGASVCGDPANGHGCGGSGDVCCSGSRCVAGDACSQYSNQCEPCGGSGQLCCAGNSCGDGLVCGEMSTCQPCGGSGQACCAGNSCGAGLDCQAGTCQSPAPTGGSDGGTSSGGSSDGGTSSGSTSGDGGTSSGGSTSGDGGTSSGGSADGGTGGGGSGDGGM